MKTEPFAATWITTKEERTPYVVLDANSRYWDKDRGPRLNRVIFRNDLSKEDALELCLSTEGKVDIVTQVSPMDASRVCNSRYAELINVNGNKIVSGIFNRYRQDIDFDDRRLRLAFNLAVDRTKLIDEAFFGYADLVPALTPPWAFDFPEELTPIKYNPVLARQLLVESGWPAGKVLKIAAQKEFERVAFVLAKHYKLALNIEVNVTVLSSEEEVKWRRVVAEKKLVPDWDILLASTTALFFEGTPAFFHREYFGSDGALRVGPEIPEMETFINKMATQIDHNMLLDAAKDLDRFTYNEVLGLFLCSPKNLYAVNKHVNFQPYRTSFELADTEVTPLHWSRR